MKKSLKQDLSEQSSVPEEWLEQELFQKLDSENLENLDMLRDVLADYLRDLFTEMKKDINLP